MAWLFALAWAPPFLFQVEPSGALQLYTPAERRWVHLCHLLFAVHVSAACAAVRFAPELQLWAVLAGLGLLCIGMAFWLWSRTAISPLGERRLPNQPPRQLRCDGPFGVVRHPLYLSYLLLAAAPVLAARRVPLLLTLAGCAVALAILARQEERRLHAQVGPAYAAYCREVKRLVPFVW